MCVLSAKEAEVLLAKLRAFGMPAVLGDVRKLALSMAGQDSLPADDSSKKTESSSGFLFLQESLRLMGKRLLLQLLLLALLLLRLRPIPPRLFRPPTPPRRFINCTCS